MKTQRKATGKGRGLRAVALATLAAISPALNGCDGSSLTRQRQAAIDEAYTTATKSIDTHAEEILHAILAKKSGSAHVADMLTGYKATWVLLRHGDAAFKRYAQEAVQTALISKDWTTHLMGRQVAEFVIELRDVEDALARKTGCPFLSVTSGENYTGSGSSIGTQELELKDALQMQVFTELASLLGGEAATQLAMSSGILSTGTAFSWPSLGIGLGVGIAVDAIVRWVMSPAGEVAQNLDKALEDAAQKQGDAFRGAMKRPLDKRRAHWSAEIPHR